MARLGHASPLSAALAASMPPNAPTESDIWRAPREPEERTEPLALCVQAAGRHAVDDFHRAGLLHRPLDRPLHDIGQRHWPRATGGAGRRAILGKPSTLGALAARQP